MATPRNGQEIERRRGAPTKPKTILAAFVAGLAVIVASQTTSVTEQRSQKYAADPVAYTHEVIGARTWGAQDDIMRAMLKPRARVAVRAGQKIGKSCVAAFIAYWFYDCFPNARVILTAPNARSIDKILWQEVLRFYRESAEPIDGKIGTLARTGLKDVDARREIVGFTGDTAEDVAGISGENLLYIIDEASGVSREVIEQIQGNLAAGTAKLLLISNPTRTEGVLFDAFYKNKKHWETFTLSVLDSPNVVAGREVFKGMASLEHVNEMREIYGEDSAWWKIRVLGQHVLNETGKILSIQSIVDAQERWHELPNTGDLQIGVDPAGAGGHGDETVFAVRRGKKIIELVAMRGLTPEAHVVHAMSILQNHRTSRDPAPICAVDSEGADGWDVYLAFRAHAQIPRQNDFELFRVRSSQPAQRLPHVYAHTRDELWANLGQWIKKGGAIPQDLFLESELHAPSFESAGLSGKLCVTKKDDIRKQLDGRSPDRADACALAVWEPAKFELDEHDGKVIPLHREEEDDFAPVAGDVYGSAMYRGRS